MEQLTKRIPFFNIDWKWTVATYCVLVLFHLVTTQFIIPPWYMRFGAFWDFFAWIGVGIAVVSIFMAYRSHKLILLEPGIAGSLYMFTIFLLIKAPGFSPYYYAQIYDTPIYYAYPGFRIGVLLFSFVVGFGSAGIFSWYRLRNETRNA